jgi:hypothetical protein
MAALCMAAASVFNLPAGPPRMCRAAAARAYVRKTLAKMSHASSDLAVRLKAM